MGHGKNGENAKLITEGVGARWSPDGSMLAFLRNPKKRGDKGSIWVVNADGTREKKVRDDDSPTWELTWHPDGKSIAFATDHNSVIFRVNLDGTGLTKIASDNRVALFYPIFSPDGQQLLADAFKVGDSRQIPAPALEAGAGNGTVLLVDLTGHQTQVIAHGIHPSVIWAHP